MERVGKSVWCLIHPLYLSRDDSNKRLLFIVENLEILCPDVLVFQIVPATYYVLAPGQLCWPMLNKTMQPHGFFSELYSAHDFGKETERQQFSQQFQVTSSLRTHRYFRLSFLSFLGREKRPPEIRLLSQAKSNHTLFCVYPDSY